MFEGVITHKQHNSLCSFAWSIATDVRSLVADGRVSKTNDEAVGRGWARDKEARRKQRLTRFARNIADVVFPLDRVGAREVSGTLHVNVVALRYDRIFRLRGQRRQSACNKTHFQRFMEFITESGNERF